MYLCLYFRKLAEAELQTNIAASDTFMLPSGQEIQKENILVDYMLPLKIIIHYSYLPNDFSCRIFELINREEINFYVLQNRSLSPLVCNAIC